MPGIAGFFIDSEVSMTASMRVCRDMVTHVRRAVSASLARGVAMTLGRLAGTPARSGPSDSPIRNPALRSASTDWASARASCSLATAASGGAFLPTTVTRR